MAMRACVGLAIGLLVVGCTASAPAVPARAEPLYFAIEVMKGGHHVGSPKLMGFSGHSVKAERRAPGAAEPDYQLVLRPSESGGGYKVLLELQLPSGRQAGELGLLHGEERSLHLGGDAELKVLLMRVDSPEFRALMSTPAPGERGTI